MAQNLDPLRDFATRYTAAWCSHNPEAVAAFFSTNGSLKINDGPPSVGRAAIAETAQSFMTAFPDLQVFFDDLNRTARASNIAGLSPAPTLARAKKSPHQRLRILEIFL